MHTTAAMDPGDHPDIHELDRLLGAQLDDVLAAEQYAARIAAQRRTSLRDQLIRAEDMAAEVALTTAAGVVRGALCAVGTDHVVVDDGRRRIVALHQVVMAEIA